MGNTEDEGRDMLASGRQSGLRRALGDIERFSASVLGMPLRGYQAEIAQAALRAISEGAGAQLTVMLPRQSGKNQIAAGRLWPSTLVCATSSQTAPLSPRGYARPGVSTPVGCHFGCQTTGR